MALELLLIRDGQIVETAPLSYRKEGGLASVDFPSLPDYTVDTILLVDNAINEVATVRADLGAFQKNTLESNTSGLRIANENLTAAASSLRDADMAEEITKFTRNQIMMSAGVAMLAQANQTPQTVLQLLNNRPQ